MILAIHQPTYLPYLGFIEKMSHVEAYAILDTVQFIRGGDAYHNRNLIKTTDGPIWLTVPVRHKHRQYQQICKVGIENSTKWYVKHWRSIFYAYEKAPFFNSYMDFFEDLYSKKWDNLASLNEYIIRYLLKEFKINTEIVRVSELDIDGKSTDLLINVCKKLGADAYLSGINGMKYLEISKIKDADIRLLLHDFKHPIYTQQYQHLEFIPNLSCIDMLFNCGENSMKILREANPIDQMFKEVDLQI